VNVQLESEVEYRPPNKCVDPIFGNPVSCDYEDSTKPNAKPLGKNTPVKVLVGGATKPSALPAYQPSEDKPVVVAKAGGKKVRKGAKKGKKALKKAKKAKKAAPKPKPLLTARQLAKRSKKAFLVKRKAIIAAVAKKAAKAAAKRAKKLKYINKVRKTIAKKEAAKKRKLR